MALLLLYQGNPAVAAGHAQVSLDLTRTHFGPSSTIAGHRLLRLGTIKFAQGKLSGGRGGGCWQGPGVRWTGGGADAGRGLESRGRAGGRMLAGAWSQVDGRGGGCWQGPGVCHGTACARACVPACVHAYACVCWFMCT